MVLVVSSYLLIDQLWKSRKIAMDPRNENLLSSNHRMYDGTNIHVRCRFKQIF